VNSPIIASFCMSGGFERSLVLSKKPFSRNLSLQEISLQVLLLILFYLFIYLFLGEISYTATLVNPRRNKGDVFYLNYVQSSDVSREFYN